MPVPQGYTLETADRAAPGPPAGYTLESSTPESGASVPAGSTLLNQESQGVSYIRPGQTAGIAGLPDGTALPGVPAAPDPKIDANTQLAQFGYAAGRDVKHTPGAVSGMVKDWWNNNEGVMGHAGPIVMSPWTVATGVLNQVGDAGTRLVQGHPADALSAIAGGNPDLARQKAAEGDLGGAAWEYWGKPGTMAAASEVGAGALGKLKGMARGSRFENNNFTRMIAPGFKGIEAYDAAETLRPLFKQEASAMGMKDENMYQRMFTGDMPTRATPGGKGDIPEPVQGMKKATAMADRVVDRVHEPIDQVINTAKNDPISPQAKQDIINELTAKQQEAQGYGSNNANAYQSMIDRVKQANNYGELNDIKKKANNKIEGLFKGNPSEIAALAGEPIIAWKDAGDAIRRSMYPELQRYVAPQGTKGWFNIADQGRLEAMAMDARDGIYTNQAMHGNMNLPEITQKYLERLGEGSMYKTHVLRRGVMLNPTPAGQFNRMFRRGLGDLGQGSTTASTSVSPQQLKLPPPSSPNLTSITPGQPVSIIPPSQAGLFHPPAPPAYPGAFNIPTGNPMFRTLPATAPERSYLGRIQEPNPEFSPMNGPSHFQQAHELGRRDLERGQLLPTPRTYGGNVADTIPESVRGTQNGARARADQIGMGHMPPEGVGAHPSNYRGLNPPTRSFTGPEMREVTNWQHHFGTEKPPQIVADGKAAVVTTSSPEAAMSARDGMEAFAETAEYKKLSPEDKAFHKEALDGLNKQIAEYSKWKKANPIAPPPNSPAEPKFQVAITPGTLGKISKRHKIASGVSRRALSYGTRMGAQGFIKPGPMSSTSPEDMKAIIEEERKNMSRPE